jgi:Uma2 family endonuclease
MANPLVHPEFGAPWTIHALSELPDDGNRYEIFDGSLIVSPPPNVSHGAVVYRLRRVLERQAPDGVAVSNDAGVSRTPTSYFIPDLFVVPETAFGTGGDAFRPADVLLVIEVLSPSNAGRDLVLKRHGYAVAGVPLYWIVDPQRQTLTVLELDGEAYREAAVARPGERFATTEPFPLELDLADVLERAA